MILSDISTANRVYKSSDGLSWYPIKSSHHYSDRVS